MPCNLAVTITKATTAPEHLQKLLTPEVIKALVESFIKTHPVFTKNSPQAHVMVRPGSEMVEIQLDYFHRLTIYKPYHDKKTWRVHGEFRRGEETLLTEMTDLLTTLLNKGADRLYARQVKSALRVFGKVEESQVKVAAGEQVEEVTLLKFEL